MQHGDKCFGEFLPTNQDATEAIHPTMSAFHHPAPSLEARLFFDGSGFFATSADMRGETELSNNAADLIEVVSLVKAQPVRHRYRRQGARRHDSFERTSDQLHVVTIGALNGERQWVHGQPGPVDSLQSIVFDQSLPPEGFEHAGLGPFAKASIRRTAGAYPRGVECIPLAASVPMGALSAKIPPTEIGS